MGIKITSSAFKDGGDIPVRYTGHGEDVSPPLSWEGAPQGTKSFALINDDPDAVTGSWVHWVIYNIPQDQTSLKENFPSDVSLPNGIKQGVTDFGTHGYGGPCPPSGKHRYFFRLYALDTMLDLSGRVSKRDIEKAIQGHILEQAQLMGLYGRGK